MKTLPRKTRTFYRQLRSLVAILACAVIALAGIATPMARAGETLQIGIIGTGKIGGALARHWARAGHELVISSRHPERLEPLAAELGPKVRTGTPAEAAEFGEVVLVSVPYGAMPQIGRDYARLLAGKVVLDTGNPFLGRDGEMAREAQRKGAGIASAEFLPGARLVRAFNCIPAYSLANRAFRQPARIAIPIASDHADALKIARRLVDDAGFDAVVVGPLARSRAFDLGQPLARGDLSAAELERLVDETWK